MSETELCNRALARIAARNTIVDMDDEDNPLAKLCRTFFASTRDALLRAAPWQCGTKTNLLTLQKQAPGTPGSDSTETVWNPETMPAMPWLYQYAYPSEALFVRWVAINSTFFNDYQPFSVILPQGVAAVQNMPYVKFEVALGTDLLGNKARVINTNAENAISQYVERVEITDLWDAAFQEAFVAALAAQLAFPVSGKTALATMAKQEAMAAIREARVRDGNEGLTVQDHVPDWVRVRGFAGPGSYNLIDGVFSPWVTPSFLL